MALETKHANTSDVETLSELHARLQIREAQLGVARAELDLAAANVFVKHGMNAKIHSVCLFCGSFTRLGVPCPCASAPQ